MGFQTGSDNEKIEELQKQFDDIIDSQLNSVGGNENLSIDSTLGARNDASGDAGGVRSNQPIVHNITDVNEEGVSTGVFDKINLISSMIIVNHTSTPMDLRFIQGPAKEGSKIIITVEKDSVLVIKSGGNILTSSDITITDTEFFILVKHSAAETGVTGGAYKILKVGTTAGAGYDTIQEEGASLTQRTTMNFIGATVTAVDNPGQSRTDITIVAGASGTLSALTIDVPKDWQTFGISNLGPLSMVGDIDLATQNIINIDQSRYVKDSGSVTTDTDNVILVNSSDNFQFNTAEANQFLFTFSNNIGIALVHDETVPLNPLRKLQILTDSTDTNSTTSLEFVRNFATSISGQIIGNVLFAAPSDAGGGKVIFSSIQGEIEDATAGQLDGAINFFAILNSSTVKFLGINDGGSGEVTLFRDLNVNTQNILNIDQSRYVVDSGVVSSITDTVILLNSNAQFQFNTDQINDFIFSFDNNAALALNQDPLDDDNRFLTIQSDSTNINAASFLNITKAFPIPLATQIIGGISFKAGTSLGSGLIEYAGITAIAQDITSPSFDGILRLETILNGSITPFIDLNNASDGKIHLFRTLDVNTNFIEITEIAQPSNPVANDGRIYIRDIAGITTPFFLDSSGTETSMIASAGISNQIIQGDSSVTVTDPSGVINFVTNNISLGNISDALGWIIDNSDLSITSTTGKIVFQNGFQIQNTNSTTTTFTIPSNETLLIKEGTSTRIQIDKNITLNANSNDDILFQEGGATVGKYDGTTNDWVFNPSNDVQLSPGNDIDLTPTDDIIMNPGGDINVFDDLDMQGSATLNSGVGLSSAPPGSPIGAWVIKIQGVSRKINVYSA